MCYKKLAMRGRLALLALAALALTAVLAPAAAWADACPEDDGDDRCTPCGVGCLCCAAPRFALASSLAGVPPGLDAGGVDSGRLAIPPAPSPRDILHVPRPAQLRRWNPDLTL